MIAIPNMEKPERCRDCRLHSYDWGDEYIPSHDVCHALSIYFNEGYEERHIKIDEEVHPDCPLIELDDELISKFAEAYLEREAEDGNIHT